MFLKLEIADEDVSSYNAVFDYQELVNGKPNPETKEAFFQRMLFGHIKQNIRTGRGVLSTEPIVTPIASLST